MELRDELLAEVGPKTHIADLCGRASDELLIKQMKIDQLKRQVEALKMMVEYWQGQYELAAAAEVSSKLVGSSQ